MTPEKQLEIYKEFYERVSQFITQNNPPKQPVERIDYVKARILDTQSKLSETNQ